jgi:hypothetical protein
MYVCYYLDPDSVDFNECVVHDLSSVFKQYLRDLPIPIMTFDLYDEFMRVAGQWLLMYLYLLFHCYKQVSNNDST